MAALVDVYIYRREQKSVKLLILKRAADVAYAGQWRMVGGKIGSGERAYKAALRELKEETKLNPQTFWTLPSVNSFYDPDTDKIHHIPTFAAEVDPDSQITLNHEHSNWKWITEDDISAYIHWPEQQRLMRLLVSIVTNNKLLDEWIIND